MFKMLDDDIDIEAEIDRNNAKINEKLGINMQIDAIDEEKFNFRKGLTKSELVSLTVKQLRKEIETFPHYYEDFTGRCVPYFDFDKKFDTKEQLEEFINSTSTNVLRGAFNRIFKNCSVYYAKSHGRTGDVYKYSYHVIVRGAGSYTCGKQIELAYADKIDEQLKGTGLQCDRSVYKEVGKRQLMRTIYSVKESDKKFKRILVPEQAGEISNDEFKNYLLSWTSREFLHDDKKPDQKISEYDGIDWELIGDSGEYNLNGSKKSLTLEQFKSILTSLNKARFSNYDEWCKLLWAVARWQDENKLDEDQIIDYLDEFCQQCENYGSKRDVVKKYNEAFKKQGRESKTTIGTVIYWLKEDDFAKYCEIFTPLCGGGGRASNKLIDRRDAYCWVDFVNDLTAKIWELPQLDEYINANIGRVLALVMRERGFYIKKDSCSGGLFNYVDTIKNTINFKIRYNSKKIDKRTKDQKAKIIIETITIADYLANNNVLKPYADIGCYPDPNVNPCPANHYNIWEGYQATIVDKVDEAKIADVKYILRELWASGDENLYKYLLGWLRFVVAHPGEMTKVALFLYSQEGAGKGAFVDFFMMYVLGLGISHSYTGISEIVEKHNTNKKGKKLAYVNEMGSTREQFINNFDQIKPLITDPIISENPKGRAIMQVDNITNIIMSTNHKNSLYIPSESDRRYTCIEVSNAKCGDEHKQWWGSVKNRIMNQDTGNHFYTWLLSLNEDDLPNPRVVFKTKLRDEIHEISRDSVLSFLDSYIEKNVNSETEDKVEEISSTELYNEYISWCSVNKEHNKSHRTFGMIVKSKLQCKKNGKGIIIYKIPTSR